MKKTRRTRKKVPKALENADFASRSQRASVSRGRIAHGARA